MPVSKLRLNFVYFKQGDGGDEQLVALLDWFGK